jgi:hypothetical protein
MIPINKIQNNHVEKLKPINTVGHETPSSRPSIIVPPQKKIPSSRPSKIDEVFRNRPTQTETHLIGLQKLFRLGCETRFSLLPGSPDRRLGWKKKSLVWKVPRSRHLIQSSLVAIEGWSDGI